MASFGNLGRVTLDMGVNAKAFRAGLTDAQKGLQSFAATMQVTGFRLAAVFASTFGAIGAFAFTVGKDFELAMAGIRKTTDLTDKEFASLETSILGVPMRTKCIRTRRP